MKVSVTIDNPIVLEERKPRKPQESPCYGGIELSTQAERDAANQRMLEETMRRMNAQMEANKRNEPITKIA